MNVYLLPHHRLDPRFRYTLEREASPPAPEAPREDAAHGLFARVGAALARFYQLLRHDYDLIVHGHEHMRLSKLVLLMDRDPELSVVIPTGMSRETAREAVRAVIHAGLMAHRSPVVRNGATALVMMIVLFGITPTHVAAILFYPLIAFFAWRRYWEDRLIRRTMHHLLDVRLAASADEHFREATPLARLEELFMQTAQPTAAYRQAIDYLDGLDEKMDGKAAPAHELLFHYYSDIGRLDPYERYQDRMWKKLVESAKLVAQHLWAFWKGVFRWTFRRTRVAGVPVPNWVFVLAVLGVAHGALYLAVKRWNAAATAPTEAAVAPSESAIQQ